jgi:hypothetical protein
MRERSMTRAAMVLAMLSGLVAPAGAAEPPGLDTVAAWMTGSFSSAAQAAADPDRGFDASGVQVWGSEKGPYVFVRDEAGR